MKKGYGKSMKGMKNSDMHYGGGKKKSGGKTSGKVDAKYGKDTNVVTSRAKTFAY